MSGCHDRSQIVRAQATLLVALVLGLRAQETIGLVHPS